MAKIEALKKPDGLMECPQCKGWIAPIERDIECWRYSDFGTPRQKLVPYIARQWQCGICHHAWDRLPRIDGKRLPQLPVSGNESQLEASGEVQPLARIRCRGRAPHQA